MPKKKRVLPPQITRFNYWQFEIASPRLAHLLQPTLQRLSEFPEEKWEERPGRTAVHRHIRQTFLSMMKSDPFEALKTYVQDDKEWQSDATAQAVKIQLSPQQRAWINRLDEKIWPQRSKRPERLKRTWNRLFSDIAADIALFERLCPCPPQSGEDELSGTERKVYKAYSKQAIKLLGGGTYIPPARRSQYQMSDIFDESEDAPLSNLLTPNGRLPSESIFEVNWLTLSRSGRRDAKRLTIHWFHHALRNLREYRNKRPPIPWGPECEQECRGIHKKLLNRSR